MKNSSSFRNTSYFSSLNIRSSSSARGLSLLNVSRYCTYSDSSPSSKRRSRGPVMLAKKASEGLHVYYRDLLENIVNFS